MDLATGESELVGNLPTEVNGAGFNVLDGNFYVWDGGSGGIGRFGAGLEYEPLGLPEGMAIGNWNMGDVDPEGFMWLMQSGTRMWVQIDVRPGSSTFGEVVASGDDVSYGGIGQSAD
ncbi:hypothetical protein [Leucobacter sp. USHLN153]|uniref:hypothetical protein n=1 Tax=Leucobacter sp. USHLN153 TaxID=3081268 RepID=UPI00301AEC04